MTSRFYGIVIQDGKVLSVETGGYTVFPGGEPKEFESGCDCLIREFSEELSGTKIKIENHYRDFLSIDPKNDEPFLCKNYFVTLSSPLGKPSLEVYNVRWIDSTFLDVLKFSDSSKKTLVSLIQDGFVK
ncbi:NUDIX hydrolase [archaeon]|nr:NUDIX hydrolase [archaeon]